MVSFLSRAVHQAVAGGGAYLMPYAISAGRNALLPTYLKIYNGLSFHMALGGLSQPPTVSRSASGTNTLWKITASDQAFNRLHPICCDI
jgi:hypothetical protein